MPIKCNSCGAETDLDACFFKGRKSFSRSVKTYCPTCWTKRRHSVIKWVFLYNAGISVLGLAFWLAWPELGIGRGFVNLFVFQVFLALTILPHELGHAAMARLLGMRVFKIYIGSGKALFTARFFGFDIEFRAVPRGGIVLATHRGLSQHRCKLFPTPLIPLPTRTS